MNIDFSATDEQFRQQVAQLAEKLKAEGLMDASRKRPIPRIPLTVGIVTSPNGAVVHDALRTFRRRFPLARMVVAGVPVEGPTAARDMTDALWLTTPWTDISGDVGQMDKTTVKFSIPMDNPISLRTVEENGWFGEVSASGEIHVQATWRNIN